MQLAPATQNSSNIT